MGQSIRLDDYFKNGLRPDSRSPRNAPFLIDCTNLRATEFGLKDFYAVNQTMTAAYQTGLGVTRTWPFPQMFRGKNITLLLDQTKLFEVTENSNGIWTMAQVTTYDAADLGASSPGTKSITGSGGTWHFMDFYGSWMLFNGVCQVFKSGFSTHVFVQDTMTIKTGWAVKEGRAFYGGFNTSNFRSSAWQTLLATYDDHIPSEIRTRLDYNLGADTNWIWWSSAGGGDLYNMFSTTIATYGSVETTPNTGYDANNPYFLDFLLRNESGMRPMPWQGSVYMGLPLGEGSIVYGSKGISGLIPVTQETGATMALVPIQGMGEHVGIASRSAAGGFEQAHMFVDDGGELWLMTASGNGFVAQRLGYGEIFSTMLGTDIVISQDPQRLAFYIANSSACYMWENGRLSGPMPFQPTTVYFSQGGRVGTIYDSSSTDAVSIKTDVIEFDEPVDLWTVRIGGTDTDSVPWVLAVDYKADKSSTTAWSTVSSITFRKTGIAYRRNISGVAFRFKFTATDNDGASLDSATAEFKMGGKRTLRRLLP